MEKKEYNDDGKLEFGGEYLNEKILIKNVKTA